MSCSQYHLHRCIFHYDHFRGHISYFLTTIFPDDASDFLTGFVSVYSQEGFVKFFFCKTIALFSILPSQRHFSLRPLQLTLKNSLLRYFRDTFEFLSTTTLNGTLNFFSLRSLQMTLSIFSRQPFQKTHMIFSLRHSR